MALAAVAVACRPLVAAAGLLALGCYKAAVYVPGELAVAPRLEVSGGGKRLAFGEYETVPRQSGGAGRFVVDVLADMLDATVEQQPVEFVVRAGGRDVWSVHCGPVEGPEQPGLWSFEQRLGCALHPAGSDSASAWRLTMETVLYQIPGGALVGPTGPLRVVGSTTTHEGQVLRTWQPLGYYVQDSGRTIAAVQVAYPRAVWLDPELTAARRDLLAAALAALLIWDRLIS